MELRHLRYFAAVAEELHFGRAAARLHVSTPTLSQQIQALEREVGALLLERGSRSVTLTRAGAALLGEARTTLLAAETAIREARRAAHANPPVVRLGLLHGVPGWLTDRLGGLARTELPDRRVVFVGGPSSEQLELLRRRELDLALVRLPVEPSDDLELLAVLEEELGVVLWGGHPLAGRDVLDPAELAGEELVWFPPRLAPGFHDAIVTRLRELCAGLRVSDTTLSQAQLRAVLPGRTSISLGTTRSAAPPDLVWRALRGRPLTVRMAAVWRSEIDDPGVEALVAALRREVEPGLPIRPAPRE